VLLQSSVQCGENQTQTVTFSFLNVLTVSVADSFGNPTSGNIVFTCPSTGAGCVFGNFQTQSTVALASGLATVALIANSVSAANIGSSLYVCFRSPQAVQ